MRRTLNTLALAALAAFTLLLPAAGQAVEPPPGEDRLGIYTKNDFDDPEMNDHIPAGGVTIGSSYSLPLLLTGMTAPSVAAVEFIMTISSTSMPLSGITWAENAVDVDSSPLGVIAGFGTPILPVSGTNYARLGTVDLLAFTTEPVLIHLIPHTTPTIDGFMVYVNGEDFGDVKATLPSSGSFDLPVFGFSTDVEVSAQDATWSGVKQLFR